MPSRMDGSKPPDWTGFPPANLDIPEVNSSSDDELIWEMGIRQENMSRHLENVRLANILSDRRRANFNPVYRRSRGRNARVPRNEHAVFYRGSRSIDWLERNQQRQNRRRARPLRQRLTTINDSIQEIVDSPGSVFTVAQNNELNALERSRNRIIDQINIITGEFYDPDEIANS